MKARGERRGARDRSPALRLRRLCDELHREKRYWEGSQREPWEQKVWLCLERAMEEINAAQIAVWDCWRRPPT